MVYYWFQELIEELGIYFVAFDRAGYGESDPNPRRSVKSEAFDIQELADQLELGSKFYIIGVSMGTYSVWSTLKYIPHRHDTRIIPSVIHRVKYFDLIVELFHNLGLPGTCCIRSICQLCSLTSKRFCK